MTGTSAHGAPRLLLIDSDEAIQLLIRTIFRRHGVAVDCVADGNTALDRLRETRYDAVILEVVLPGRDGFEIIRELKVRDAELLGRMIVLTAGGEGMLRSFTDGWLVRCVMRKPFDVDELVDEILGLLPPGCGRGIAVTAEERVW